jgi:NAD(P)-dependent dehydrogenase (short-subunit alcohol dehydrogenase family)
MVSIKSVYASNAQLKASKSGIVAVVVGGTNGIGRAFLTELASSIETSKIYIVGRSEKVLGEIKSDLSSIETSNEYISIQASDLTLISNVEKATKQIAEQEKGKVDILYMSPGYLTLAARDETTEGLDKLTSIRYYARMRFVLNLLPLLNAAPSPRVVSTLAGGQEGKIFPDDMSLKDPKNYGVASAGNTAATFTTLFFEQIQKQNPKISFVHMFPGLVKTNLINAEHFGAVFAFIFNWVILPLVGPFLFLTAKDAGARALYAATNEKFGAANEKGAVLEKGSNEVIGSGVYILNENDEALSSDAILAPYRKDGTDKKIYDHTMEEYKRILG